MSKDPRSLWTRYQTHLCRYHDSGFSLDISRMTFSDSFFATMENSAQAAYRAMDELEGGAIANPDEQRMVGHYWLRNTSIAPNRELSAQISTELKEVKSFARDILAGRIRTPSDSEFSRVLVVGIGGSALGPQLVADCLTSPNDPGLSISFFDNTDPDGLRRTIDAIGTELSTTLTVVISKSGGTPETRNGMLVAEAAYKTANLDFSKYAVAVTGVDSRLDNHASNAGWLKRFPMSDWVGGRTSVMSVVGLVPAALQGVDVDAFLKGAADMDSKTRSRTTSENAAMLLALMWHHAGDGKGSRDMVILPYKDRFVLFSKYLQQLVMESLGKEHDLDGNQVFQGIAVYGNKGSTDQHAYVQQLRDGVENFFATFIEVREDGGDQIFVDENVTPGNFLQGFLRGTRTALQESGRQSMTISVPRADAYVLGSLIALFERAVGFYATLVNINAYHQPGVEAGKKAAASFLEVISKSRTALTSQPATADAVATQTGCSVEDTYHALTHLAANHQQISQTLSNTPAEDTFSAH